MALVVLPLCGEVAACPGCPTSRIDGRRRTSENSPETIRGFFRRKCFSTEDRRLKNDPPVASRRPAGQRVPLLMEALPYLGQALEQLLEAVDLPSVFLASFIEKFMPLLPSYVLFPAIGMGASAGPTFCAVPHRHNAVSVGGAAGWYCVGALIGPWAHPPPGRRLRPLGAVEASTVRSARGFYRGRPFRITVAGQLGSNDPRLSGIARRRAAGCRCCPSLPATAIGGPVLDPCPGEPPAICCVDQRLVGAAGRHGIVHRALTIEAAALLIVLPRPGRPKRCVLNRLQTRLVLRLHGAGPMNWSYGYYTELKLHARLTTGKWVRHR